MCLGWVAQSCLTLCNPVDCCPPPLSMGFSRQEYWSGLPCPPPGDLPNPGIEPRSPAMQADSFPSEPPGKPFMLLNIPLNDLGVVGAAFSRGFPGGSVVKNLPAKQEHVLDPRVGEISWRRKWKPTPVFLPGKSHRQRSLVGYTPWDGKELNSNRSSLYRW